MQKIFWLSDDDSSKKWKNLYFMLFWKIIILRIVYTNFRIFSHLGSCGWPQVPHPGYASAWEVLESKYLNFVKKFKITEVCLSYIMLFLTSSHKGTLIPCEYSLTQIVVIVIIVIVSDYTHMVSRCLYGKK